MPELLCPSCGAEVPLHSAAMPYAVCSYCQSLLLREGGALQSVGTSAVLPFDVSPIMIGTNQFPNPPMRMGMAMKKIINTPCTVMNTL